MANNYYGDLDNDFPNAIDAYEPISDVTDATFELAQKYQSYINQGSDTYGGSLTGFQLAEKLKLDYPVLEKMDVTAKKLNRMQQMIISLQRYARSLKLQTVLSLNEPNGSIKQVVGSIWGKITNTLNTGEHKVTLKVKEAENSYVTYYPKTTADQVLYFDENGGAIDGDTKLKEEIQKIKDIYQLETYTDISQLGIMSYKLADIIHAMPEDSLFMVDFNASSKYLDNNILPCDSGIIKISKSSLDNTELEVTNIANNGSKYIHFHAVYTKSTNTVSNWHEISYSDHLHDNRYYPKTDIDGQRNQLISSINSTNTAIVTTKNEILNTTNIIKNELNYKIDSSVSAIHDTTNEISVRLTHTTEDLDERKFDRYGGSIHGTTTVGDSQNHITLDPSNMRISSSKTLIFRNESEDNGNLVGIVCDDIGVDWIVGSKWVTGGENSNYDVRVGVDTALRVHKRDKKGNQDDYRAVYASDFKVCSDRKLKMNITPIKMKESKKLITSVSPMTYQFKSDGKDAPYQRGMIAQEVMNVVEEMGLHKQIYTYDEEMDMYLLNYTALIPDLINTTQDLYNELEDKENKINLLEERILKLENNTK